MFCDASKRAWGGVLIRDGESQDVRDYFAESQESNINVLEALALHRVLVSFKESLRSTRVDVFTDSKTLQTSWLNGGCRDRRVNDIIKEILLCSRAYQFTLHFYFVPSKDNPADGPSRVCSDLDCTLSDTAWLQVESLFGPHTFDLMARSSIQCFRPFFLSEFLCFFHP